MTNTMQTKKKPGRPAENLEGPAIRVCVMLDQRTIDKVRSKGQGNLSNGIRLLAKGEQK